MPVKLCTGSQMTDQTQLPLISIITPSYNQAQYIRATIESVLGQDYPNIEHIVVDGASTDGTVDILKEYSSTYPTRFRWLSEPDRGQSDAFNKGLALARGTYIGWQNSDDYYKPGAFRSLVEALERSDAAVAYSGVDCIDEHGRVIVIAATVPYDAHHLVFSQYVFNQGALMRHEAVAAINGLDVNLNYNMDHDFFLRLSVAHRFVAVSPSYGVFRIHNLGKTGAKRPDFFPEAVHVLERFFMSCHDERVAAQHEALSKLHRTAAVVYAAYDRMEEAYHHAALVDPAVNADLHDPRTLAALVLYGPQAIYWQGKSRLAAVERALTVVESMAPVTLEARQTVLARFYAEEACLLREPRQTMSRLRLLVESLRLDPRWINDRRELVVQMLNIQFGERFTRRLIDGVHRLQNRSWQRLAGYHKA